MKGLGDRLLFRLTSLGGSTWLLLRLRARRLGRLTQFFLLTSLGLNNRWLRPDLGSIRLTAELLNLTIDIVITIVSWVQDSLICIMDFAGFA